MTSNKTVYYFGYGANMSKEYLENRRRVFPSEIHTGVLKDYKLIMNMEGPNFIEPSFANIIVWKTLYESDNYYYIDAIRLTSNSKFIPGTKTKKLNIEESFPWLDRKSKQAIDIERFRWFSDNYLSQSQKYPLQIMDVRFTSLPHTLSPLWSIELDP